MDEFASRTYPVKEHMRFQRRMWIVERVGWGVLAGVAALALTGLFGVGWLSKANATGGGLTVQYERFQRATKVAEFTFRFDAGDGERRLVLDRTFQANYEISSIQPEPLRSEAGLDGMTFTFATGASGGTVSLWAHPRSYGISRIEARSGDAAPAAFSVMVYP
jgi:hypothetical protein